MSDERRGSEGRTRTACKPERRTPPPPGRLPERRTPPPPGRLPERRTPPPPCRLPERRTPPPPCRQPSLCIFIHSVYIYAVIQCFTWNIVGCVSRGTSYEVYIYTS